MHSAARQAPVAAGHNIEDVVDALPDRAAAMLSPPPPPPAAAAHLLPSNPPPLLQGPAEQPNKD